MTKEEQLHAYLKSICAGRQKVTPAAALERQMAISGNELRKQVNRLRRKGVPIASSRDGYFYAVTASEIYTTIRQLKKMAAGLDAAIQGLECSLERFSEDDRQ